MKTILLNETEYRGSRSYLGPVNESDKDLFMHISDGCIAVARDYLARIEPVAAAHNIRFVVESEIPERKVGPKISSEARNIIIDLLASEIEDCDSGEKDRKILLEKAYDYFVTTSRKDIK